MSAVWCADDTFLGDLIYLDDASLVIDSPDDEKTPGIKQALLGGTPAAQVLSSDSTNIPLLSITSVRTDRNDEDIEIHYKSGKETEEHTLRLSSKEKRDEVMESLGQSGLLEIEQIKAALERFDKDTFGICAGCGESISLQRLETIPHAARCRHCA